MIYLKQSTASQSVLIGPFIDDTDGKTAETGLTIANTDIRLSKNGGNMAAKNSGGGTHDEAGWYTITLDATDTNTVGRLQISVDVAGALPVWLECHVLEEAIYDALFGASAAGFDSNGRVDVGSFGGTAVTGRDIGASVLLSPGTGTGQISLSSGKVTLADGVAHGGSTATLELGASSGAALTIGATSTAVGVNVTSSSGRAVNVFSSGADALRLDSNGGFGVYVEGSSAGLYVKGDLQHAVTLEGQPLLSGVSLNAPQGITANVTGNLSGSVGSVATGGITAASIATDAIDADALAADAVAEIQSGLSTLDATGVRAAVGLATANLDTQLAAIVADTNELQTDWADGGRLDLILDATSTLTASQVNAEVLDVLNVDTLVAGVTIAEAVRRIGTITSGTVSGAGSGTETFTDWADSANTIVVTVDASGNRSGITFN